MSLMLIRMMGLATGSKIGKRRTGKMNDLCFTYIESADTNVPVIHRLTVGSKIASRIKSQIGTLIEIPEGLEMNNPNKKMIASMRQKISMLKTILLKKRVLIGVGDEINPSSVPDSFSFTNNFAIINNKVKNTTIQIWITKISAGMLCSPVPTVKAVEKMNTEMISNRMIEMRSLACRNSNFRSFKRMVRNSLRFEISSDFFSFM